MPSNTVGACPMHSSRKADSTTVAIPSTKITSEQQKIEYVLLDDLNIWANLISPHYVVTFIPDLPRRPRRCCAGEISAAFLARATSSPGKRKHHTHGDLSPTTALSERSRNSRSSASPSGEQFCRMLFYGHQRFVLVVGLDTNGQRLRTTDMQHFVVAPSGSMCA